MGVLSNEQAKSFERMENRNRMARDLLERHKALQALKASLEHSFKATIGIGSRDMDFMRFQIKCHQALVEKMLRDSERDMDRVT